MSAAVIDLAAFRTGGTEQRAELVRSLVKSQCTYTASLNSTSLDMQICRAALALNAICEKVSAGFMQPNIAVAALRAIRDELKKHAVQANEDADNLARARRKAKKLKKRARRK